jgi:excisionase family DNA binding protein
VPRTKKHVAETRVQLQPPVSVDNGAAGEVLTLTEAATYLRVPEQHVALLVQQHGLPGRFIAGELRFLKAAIQRWLGTASPSWETKKGAILDLAGKYEDDPDLEQIVAEAYRRRRRSITD